MDLDAFSAIRSRVAALAVEHPALGLSFGYVGNCSLYTTGPAAYDHRSWSVFTKLATPDCHQACNVRFGDVATNKIHDLANRTDSELAAWCIEQERRLAAGEVRIVRPQPINP